MAKQKPRLIVQGSGSQLLLFSTARIVAKSGSSESVGTAFFFQFKLGEKKGLPVLVTNTHVIKGAEHGSFVVHERLESEEKDSVAIGARIHINIDRFSSRWVPHPDGLDLCAMPFQPLVEEAAHGHNKKIFYMPFDESLLRSDDQLKEFSALEEVVMVGYPIGLSDTRNNLPLLRRGVTSSHPESDFNGEPVGVVDIAAFPGSSGSPVLIFNESGYTTPKGIVMGKRVVLLGALYAGPQFAADGNLEITEIPTGAGPVTKTNIPVHLGYYIKAKELLRLKEHMVTTLGVDEGKDTPNR